MADFVTGQRLAAEDLNDALGRVLVLANPTSNTDHTTTESFAFTATVEFINGHYYEFLAQAAQANTVSASQATFRWRTAAGGTVAITDTERYRVIDEVSGAVRGSRVHAKTFQWTDATGTYTAGFSIQSTANTTRWYGDTNAKTHKIVHHGA